VGSGGATGGEPAATTDGTGGAGTGRVAAGGTTENGSGASATDMRAR
jgi:hypothetical protein